MRCAFRQAAQSLRALGPHTLAWSGTTATLVALTRSVMVTAHVGDSRACLFRLPDDADLDTHPARLLVTRDHSPALPDEAARILARGGRVDKQQVVIPQGLFPGRTPSSIK